MDYVVANNANKSLSLDTVIFSLLNFIVLVDLVNGYFLNRGSHLPIAQLYKLALVVLLLTKLFYRERINKKVWFIIAYTFLFIFYYLITEGFDLLSESITHLTKLGLIIISYVYFSFGIKNNQSFFFNKIIKFAKISLFFFAASLILSLFGFGFSSYGGSTVGNKSFFNGANDLGVALVTLFSFLIFYILSAHYKKSIQYLFFVLFVFLSVVVSTKMVMIGTLLSLIILPYIFKNANTTHKNSKLKNLVLLIFFFTTGIGVFGYIISKTQIFERIQFYYQMHDLGFVIFSGRVQYLQRDISNFFNSNFLIQCFGLGGNRTIELDFFDVLFNYGYFGVIWVYSFYGSLYFSALRKSKDRQYPFAPYVLYINVLLTFVSLLSGHVLFSAMGGIFISVVNSLSFYKGNLKRGNSNISIT